MEKINNHNSESNCNSDTESVAGENDLLYEFIFGKSSHANKEASESANSNTYAAQKANNKHIKSSYKNGRQGKIKKTLQTIKKDTESPYRKVLVTTDLKSDSKLSKCSSVMILV